MYHEWLAKVEELFWHKDLEMPMKERQVLFEKLRQLAMPKCFYRPGSVFTHPAQRGQWQPTKRSSKH